MFYAVICPDYDDGFAEIRHKIRYLLLKAVDKEEKKEVKDYRAILFLYKNTRR
jgi:hypothetical protein